MPLDEAGLTMAEIYMLKMTVKLVGIALLMLWNEINAHFTIHYESNSKSI